MATVAVVDGGRFPRRTPIGTMDRSTTPPSTKIGRVDRNKIPFGGPKTTTTAAPTITTTTTTTTTYSIAGSTTFLLDCQVRLVSLIQISRLGAKLFFYRIFFF